MPGRALRVVVVDDHELVRDAIVAALMRSDIEVVGQAASVAEAEVVVLAARPDVVVVDINLPDASGIQLVRRLATRMPSAQIVMLSVSGASTDVYDAIRAGAAGYLTKDVSSESLVRAVRGAHAGELSVPRRLARELVRSLAADAGPASPTRNDAYLELSERERVILTLVAAGRTTREIAEALALSPRTVEGHVGHILRKLGVRNRAEAAARLPSMSV